MKNAVGFYLLPKIVILLGILLLNQMFLAQPLYAQGPQDAVQRLRAATGGTAQVNTSKATGVASFIRIEPGSIPFKANSQNRQATARQAISFLQSYGQAFGIRDANQELQQTAIKPSPTGGASVSYQQVYQGVPVFAGIMRVHFDARGDVFAVNGTFIPDLKLNVSPTINAQSASNVAVNIVIDQLSIQGKTNTHKSANY